MKNVMQKFLPKFMKGAALAAVLMTLPAQAVEAQAALEIVRKLEAIEARLTQIERRAVPVAQEAPAPVSDDIAALRAEVERLGAELTTLRGDGDAANQVQADMASLAQEVAALRATLDAAQSASAGAPESEIEASFGEVLAEVRSYMQAQAEREAAPAPANPLTIAGRVQAQYATTSAPGVIGSDFFIRRARLELEYRVNSMVSGRLQPDFGAGKISLKDAYLALAFSPALGLTVGQFKRPFDIFEITSSTRVLTVEREGTIRGAGSCAGPGGICSFSRFTQKLGYSDRDIGVRLNGRAGDFAWETSATNGAGANVAEENDSKSYGARVVWSGISGLAFAANVAAHDYENDVDAGRTHAVAYGLDLEWGNYTSGWHSQVGGVFGDNWLNLDAAGVPSTFYTAQGILTYKHPLGITGLDAIEPLTRVSWGDPDTGNGNDGELFVTGGLVAHLIGRNKIAINVERWIPISGGGEWSVKAMSYLHF